jgi:hypothetical protein
VRTIAPRRISARIETILFVFFGFLYILSPLNHLFRKQAQALYPILTIVFIGTILFTLRRIYIKKKEDNIEESFWDRERSANMTPKTDITNLPYITIPLDKFPLESTDSNDEKLLNDLKTLSEEKILNLNGLTNTDLKEKYGPSNLNTLNEIGENFNTLCTILIGLAENAVSREDYPTAEKYLEYGSGIRSDISKNYILLGKCYMEEKKYRKIQPLMEYVSSLNLPLEHSVMAALQDDLDLTAPEKSENLTE